MTDDELRMAHELAEAEGGTVAELLRRYIRKAHAKVVVAKQNRDAKERSKTRKARS
ncbi:MAG TPA: hypothetical protein VGG39_08720 [Polyangiaceae bacterium]